MPKTIPIIAHYQSGAQRLATAIKITRPDSTVYGFTSADADVTISAVEYKALPGLDVSSLLS